MNRKILLFIALSMFDVMTTDYVLALGGEEVNPVFNYFLEIGWTVWETKIALLIPMYITWCQLRGLDRNIAEICLDFSLNLMKILVIIEIIGLLYIWF